MPDTWIVNDRDLRDLGFYIDRFNGPTDGIVVETETIDAPGRAGVIPVSPEGNVSVRDLSCRGHLEAATAAALEAKYTALKDWVSRGMTEIRTGLNSGKVFHGWYQRAMGDPLAPQLLRRWGSIALTFRCFDALGYDLYERVITLSATPAQIPQSNGPLSGAIRVKGVTTSPLTAIVRDHAGRTIGTVTLGFTGQSFTLGANDRVEINSQAGTITKYTAGVASDAMQYLVAASNFPIVIGKDASDRDAGAYATIEISTGLSTGASAEWIGARTSE